MAASAETLKTDRTGSGKHEQMLYQLTKFFARRSGTLLTDSSLQVLASILQVQLLKEGGEPAVDRLISALKEENGAYRNEHFPE